MRKRVRKTTSPGSLDAFFQIVRREEFFKIQVVTLESLETFETLLLENGVGYVKQFSSNMAASDRIVLILRDSDVRICERGRYILFSNVRHRDFVQIVFCLSVEEKASMIGDEHVARAYSYKNVAELRRIVSKREFQINRYFGSGLDYLESVIVFVVANRNKLDDILRGVREIDGQLDNSFLLRLKLNGLVDKLFISRNGDSYRINVSEETVKMISRRVGLNTGGDR